MHCAHVLSTGGQRRHHRQPLRAHRARLHDGLRRPQAAELRPWRSLHDRGVRRLLHHPAVRRILRARHPGAAPAAADVRRVRGGRRRARRGDRALRIPSAAPGAADRAADHRPRRLVLPAELDVAAVRIPDADLPHVGLHLVSDRDHAGVAAHRHRADHGRGAEPRAHGGVAPGRDPHDARQVDARRGDRPGGRRDARHRRQPHDRGDVLPRLGAGRHRRCDGRARVQPGVHPHGLRGRAEGVHRGSRGRDRQHRRRGARRAADRTHRGLRHRLLLIALREPDRVRGPDRGHARAALGPARARAAAEGVSALPPVGVDEWVARSGERHEAATGWRGAVERVAGRVGWWPRLAMVGVVGALIPLLGLNDFQLQVGVNALLLAMLAVGLNIAVGWAGLLDLCYIAFYGFGAYGFALLSSNQLGSNGIHLQAEVSIPIIMLAAAALGLLVGLPSRRLIGDYLAIVTLFFGEVFLEVTTNVGTDTLGGPNGIPAIDPIKGFGQQILTLKGYYYFLLIAILVVIAALHLLDQSRTGRAWRAVREDPLAANMMTIPVNRLKLMAFSFGALVAALAGTIFAASQGGVFPNDFDTPFLILIYAGLILGGSGSIAGAVLGGLVVSVTLEFLRNPTEAGYLFYGMIILTLVARTRPWVKLAGIVVGT